VRIFQLRAATKSAMNRRLAVEALFVSRLGARQGLIRPVRGIQELLP
jgi:hypothetical protein